MIDRRDLMIGLACVGGAGAAAWLQPRRRIDLLGGRTLENILPDGFAPWAIAPGIGALIPPSEGSLSDRLYDEIIAKGYQRTDRPDTVPVMLLATHGKTQSDALQLHRPEACYPAVGFAITDRRLERLALAPGLAVPVVHLTARLGERIEDIVYWARIGDDLPQTAAEQRRDKLRAAMAGYVPDGVLMRFSAVRADIAQPTFPVVIDCIRSMVAALPVAYRPALFGRP